MMRSPPHHAKPACVLLLAAGAGLTEDSIAQEAGIYDVDAQSSDIHWLVYSDGVFRRIGHNHVISAIELSGTVRLESDGSRSTFELSIPVSELVVDDPSLRNRHGEEFGTEPSANDVNGTRRNMLGKRVLDAAHYPNVRVLGEIGAGGFESAMLSVTVQMLGRDIPLSVPSRIVIEGNTLVASGEFSLTHSDLDMKPFRAALGTLRVGQQIDCFYRVTAIKAD